MRRGSRLTTILAVAAVAFSPGPARPAAAASARLVGVVTDDGLHTADFQTDGGTLHVSLPDDLAAGDTIAGTVRAEATGGTDAEREANESRLAGFVVEVDGVPAAPDGRGIWRVPADLSRLPVVLRDADGRVLAQADVPVLAGAVPVEEFVLPTVGQAGDPLTIAGPFDGDPETTTIRVGDAPVQVLAESPRQVVVTTPATGVGPVVLHVEEADRTASGTLRLVGLALSAGDLSLQRGETTELRVRVTGLEGLDEPLPLRVTNETPSVVRLEGSSEMVIQPSEVAPDGSFNHTSTLSGLVPGGFGIRARVRGPEPERLLPTSPAPSADAGPRPTFSWRPLPVPGTTYDLTLSPLPEGAGGATTPAEESTAPGEPVLRVTDLTEPRYAYPPTGPELPPGTYAWRVRARTPGGGAGDTGPILISTGGTCWCDDSNFSLTAILTDPAGNRLRSAEMSSNPHLVELPPGPVSVALTGAGLGCKECEGGLCQPAAAANVPASGVLRPTANAQTFAVTTTWTCARTGCESRMCAKESKLRYRLAGKTCLCGELRAVVAVRHADPRRGGSRTANLLCHRGREEPAIVDLREDPAWQKGDRLVLRISGIGVACWCGEGRCSNEATNDRDADANRPVTLDLGENEPRVSNDNNNLQRVGEGGWQADGSYEFEVRIQDEKTNARGVYQDVTMKSTCTHDECKGDVCSCTWRLALGSF